jgi:hypothetical protein
MIEAVQRQVTTVANVALTTLYWQIGHRVHTAVLDGKRAEYGAQIVATASRQLAERYGRGFNDKSLRHMLCFTEAFPHLEIVSTASRQLEARFGRGFGEKKLEAHGPVRRGVP